MKIKHTFSKSCAFAREWKRNVEGAGSGSWSWSLFPKYSVKFYFIIQSFIVYRHILRVWELLKSRYIFLHKIGNVTKIFLSPALCLRRVSRNSHKQTSEGAEKPMSQTFFNCEFQWFVFYCHSGERLIGRELNNAKKSDGLFKLLIPTLDLISVPLWPNTRKLLASLFAFLLTSVEIGLLIYRFRDIGVMFSEKEGKHIVRVWYDVNSHYLGLFHDL